MKKRIHIVDLALMNNEGTGNPYPTSPHEWMSVKAVEERDAEIEELKAENERLTTTLRKTEVSFMSLAGEANRLEAENERLTEELEWLRQHSTAENETLTDALRQIRTWAEAYPPGGISRTELD